MVLEQEDRPTMMDIERQDNDMDDVAWLNLFIQLTGGFSDVVTENRSVRKTVI